MSTSRQRLQHKNATHFIYADDLVIAAQNDRFEKVEKKLSAILN